MELAPIWHSTHRNTIGLKKSRICDIDLTKSLAVTAVHGEWLFYGRLSFR
jgi:hypothetical protein